MNGSTTRLVWKRTTVQGRTALYGVAGEGVPVLFLHGWALGQHSYKRALKRLVTQGARVYAPALPGFGGTPDLPDWQFALGGYAAWVDEFLSAVKVDEPVFLVGHSFGGGVAIQVAHDFADRVRYLVLVNSIGGSTWSSSGSVLKSLAERPLWDWGIHFREDILPFRQVTRILPVILEDALPNLIRNPRAVWRVGHLARKADLTAELEELKHGGLPVVVLWGESDRVIPRASFDALCQAIGLEGEVVTGNHSWLLADPDAFGEVMTNVVNVANLAQSMGNRDGRHRREPAETSSEPDGQPLGKGPTGGARPRSRSQRPFHRQVRRHHQKRRFPVGERASTRAGETRLSRRFAASRSSRLRQGSVVGRRYAAIAVCC